jgi:hypothetical protein
MTTIDLNNIQQAMDWLAETPGGDQALAGLAKACDDVQEALPVKLNTAEMRYILERLMQQRQLDGWNERLPEPEVAGFAQQPYAGLYPQQTGVGRAQLPSALSTQLRVVNFGFAIKASIPVADFYTH